MHAANAAHARHNVRAHPVANLRLLGVLLNLALLTGNRTTEALNIASSSTIPAAATDDDANAKPVSDHARISAGSAIDKASLSVEAAPYTAEVPSARESAAALQNLSSSTWAAVQSPAAQEAAAFEYPDPFFLGGGTVEDLLDWVRTNGGEVHFEVKEVCPGCMRGAVAIRDFKEGDMVASLPRHLFINLGREGAPPGEEACDLPDGTDVTNHFACVARWAVEMATNTTYNATWAPYLNTLPPPGLLSPEMWTPDLMDATQSKYLARMVQERVDSAEAVWRHFGFDGGEGGGSGVQQRGRGVRMSLPAFKHLLGCVNTRRFGLDTGTPERPTTRSQLLPMFDMVNCADPGLLNRIGTDNNAEQRMVPEADPPFQLVALRSIPRGQEVTVAYSEGELHRPDQALFSFGFVPPRHPPLLSSVDLPAGFGGVEEPPTSYPQTPIQDPDYDNPQGQFTTAAELERLRSILSKLPTSVKQDTALLRDITDWRLATVVQWRIGRKRALRAAVRNLAATLASSQGTRDEL